MCPRYIDDYKDDYKKEMQDYQDYLTAESAIWANSLGIPGSRLGHNDARDAFRHAYSSGVIANEYGSGIAYAAGLYNELDSNYNNDPNHPPQPPGEDNMDTFNNAIGRRIGRNAASRKDIAHNTYNALARGELIIDPNSNYHDDPFFENDDLYTQPLGIPDDEDDDFALSLDDEWQGIFDQLNEQDSDTQSLGSLFRF